MFGFIFAVSIAATSPPEHPPRPTVRPKRESRYYTAQELYSAHARRRLASYLRLRLLEMREQHLERAAEVIRKHLPPDVLLGP